MKMKYYFIAAAIALLAVFVAVPVGAGEHHEKDKKHDLNRLLTGDYAMNLSFVCAQAPGGFDENLNRLADPPGSTVSGSSQGVVTYDGVGRLTFHGQVLAVTHDPGGSSAPLTSPVSQYDMACWGTYQVNHDLSIESQYDCRIYPLAGPFTLPPYSIVPGFYIEIRDLLMKAQLLGTMDNILQLRSDTEPNVEKLYLGPEPFFDLENKVSERICTNSGTAMKIVGKGN